MAHDPALEAARRQKEAQEAQKRAAEADAVAAYAEEVRAVVRLAQQASGAWAAGGYLDAVVIRIKRWQRRRFGRDVRLADRELGGRMVASWTQRHEPHDSAFTALGSDGQLYGVESPGRDGVVWSSGPWSPDSNLTGPVRTEDLERLQAVREGLRDLIGG